MRTSAFDLLDKVAILTEMKPFLPSLLLMSSVTGGFAFTANDSTKTISTDGSYSDTTNACAYVSRKNQDDWVMTVGSPGASYTWSGPVTLPIGHTFTFQGVSAFSRPTISSTTTSGFGISVSPHNKQVDYREGFHLPAVEVCKRTVWHFWFGRRTHSGLPTSNSIIAMVTALHGQLGFSTLHGGGRRPVWFD